MWLTTDPITMTAINTGTRASHHTGMISSSAIFAITAGLFLLPNLFSDDPALKKRMRQLWKHSTRVAALCFVLAKQTRAFPPDQALLAGLIHDIGEIAVITYLDKYAPAASLSDEQPECRGTRDA